MEQVRVRDENQFALNKLSNPPEIYDHVCATLVETAEKELAAFVSAVTRLYGAEQAELSAEDWLQELSANQNLPASGKELRRITVNASARLASRAEACCAAI